MTARARVPVTCPNCGRTRLVDKRNAWTAIRLGTWCRPCWAAAATAAATAEQASIDEMAVERLLAGMPVNSTRAERQAAVAALTARQKTAAEIAERLRVSQRTVVRLRARERVSA